MSVRITPPLRSPWRYVAAGAALSSGLARMVDIGDGFAPGVWFGMVLSALTAAWFVLAAVLAWRDSRAAWHGAGALVVMSALAWLAGRQLSVADPPASSRSAMAVQVAGCAVVLAAAVWTLRPAPAVTAVRLGLAQRRWLVAAAAAVLAVAVGTLGSVALGGSGSVDAANAASMRGMHDMHQMAGSSGFQAGTNETISTGRTRTYYIGADEVEWNYASLGYNGITGQPFDDEANVFVQNGPGRIGSTYVKCLYRGYTDSSFNTLATRPSSDAYLGSLGPVIRAEVGDTIVVNFRNACSFATSIHPHGVFYAKNSEGAPYADGTSGSNKADDAVPQGGRYTYTWQVPSRAGPGPHDGSSVMWMYHSHTDEVGDTYAGLMGPMVVTAQGSARSDGSPQDVDREVFELFSVMNENASPYLDTNIDRYAQPPAPDPEDDGFIESNLMHSINGYVFGSQPTVSLNRGDRVRWYVMGMGTEVDLHTPHWHGNVVTVGGMRMDVVSLLPATMVVADMVPDDVGTWLFHCHVNDHISAGMLTRYQVR